MTSRWLLEYSEELNDYQIYSEEVRARVSLTAFNVFALRDKLVFNLLFEDEEHLYPVLFAELRPAEKKLIVPSCVRAIVSEREVEIVRKRLEEANVNLGEHATIFVVEERSFVAELLGKSHNPHRTPYHGLSDIRTQKNTYLLYKQIADCLRGKATIVLDLGCGSGYGSALLAKSGLYVSAIDIDELPVDFAKRLFVDRPVSFACQSIDDIVDAGQKFDAVVACEVLEHVDEPETLVDKLLRAVRPEGYIAVCLPSWKHHGIDLNSDHRSNWTLTKAEKFLKRFFRIESTWSINFSPDPELYSIDRATPDRQDGEHFLVFGKRSAPSGFNTCPYSVLLVCHNVPPYKYTRTPLVTWRYARELKQLGYRVGVIVPNLPAEDSGKGVVLEEKDDISIYRVPPSHYPDAFIEALFSTDRRKLQPVEAVFNHFRPDIVHMVDYVLFSPQILQLASDFGAAVIRHICNTEEICLRGSPVIPHRCNICSGPADMLTCAGCMLSREVERNELFSARDGSLLVGKLHGWNRYIRFLYDTVVDGVIFTSTAFRDYFTRYLPIPESKIYIVPHGLPPGAKQPSQKCRSGERVIFGYLGAIALRKGIDALARAFKDLLPDRVELQVYGKICDQALFEELLNVPCANYLGEYTPDDLDVILNGIDVGIVPSHFETYSLVLREFLSRGIPVIATRFFGSDIVQDGENGFLVEVGDAGGLREKVLTLVHDRNLLSRIKAGAQSTRVPTLRGEVDAIHGIYQEIYARKYGTRKHKTCPAQRTGGPSASVIIPVYNNWQYTRRCLASLDAAGYRNQVEVIVVDNASADETPVRLKNEFPWVKVIRSPQNLGFAAACNTGAAAATGQYLVFLNNDTEVERGWLEALLAACEAEHGAAIVGSKLLYPDGRLQHAGVGISYAGTYPIHSAHLRYGQPDSEDARCEVDAVTGASMLLPRDVFYELGGFDEIYENGYEDVDICLKARQRGYRIIYEPASRAIHYESRTPGRFDREWRNINILHRRWLPYVIRHYRKNLPSEKLCDVSRPPVSVVIVTYNSLATIAPCIESVLATTADADEIIVVDNNSRDETAYYVECLREDLGYKRIRLCCEIQNLGYARAAARGAELATHDFLIFLNPDTVVFPGWIEGLIAPLAQNNSVTVSGPVSNYAAGLQNVARYLPKEIFAKGMSVAQLAEFLLQEHRDRLVPTDLLIGFCLAVKRCIYEELGGFDKDLFLGNDDLDFSWRLARAGYQQVVVPSVFVFHKEQESFITESGARTKYLVQQSTNQLYEKLYSAYRGSPPDGKSLWGIEWFSPQRDLVSVIVPVYKDLHVTKKVLETIVRQTSRSCEVIIVDNGGDEETGQALANFAAGLNGKVKVIRNEENLGYPLACNQGLAAANGDYIVVMNNDVVVTPHWASRMMAAFAIDPSIGIVGPRTNYCAGVQIVTECSYDESSLDSWAEQWYLRHAGTLRPTNRLIGFLWMMKRDVVEKIGGFDPLFGIGNYEDDDYCIRAQLAGYKLVIADDVFVHHYGSQSFKKQPDAYVKLLETNKMLFAGKWEVDFTGNSYRPDQVVARLAAKSLDRDTLYISLDFSEVFSSHVEPLDVGCAASFKIILCVPDPSDTEQAWLRLVRDYLKTFRPDEEVGLVIRVEPPSGDWFVKVVSAIQEMARKEGIDLNRNDLVVEARNIPSNQRGRLYRAANVFVALPGIRKQALVREAQACGLHVLDLVDLSGVKLQLAKASKDIWRKNS